MLKHVENLYRELGSQPSKAKQNKAQQGKQKKAKQEKVKSEDQQIASEPPVEKFSEILPKASPEKLSNPFSESFLDSFPDIAASLNAEQEDLNKTNKRTSITPIQVDPFDETFPILSKAHVSKTPSKAPLHKTYEEFMNEQEELKRRKSIPSELQPREKLELFGTPSMSNRELVSLLLGSGSKDQPVGQLAKKVFSLLAREPFATSLESLKSIKGMGISKSALVLAAMELGRRLLCPNPRKLDHPSIVFRNIVHFADQQENLIALNLNGACEMISVRLVTRGTVNRSLIHPREVFSHAVREQAHSVIIAHNHPSGNLKPSNEDLQSTQCLQKAGKILGIKLLDHLIFSADAYLSLVEEGYMKH